MMSKQETKRLWEVYLKENGRAWLSVKSGSMSPIIPVGSRVLVSKCRFEDLRLFDVIVFKSNENFIVHRVLKKSKHHLLQGGDNFASPSIIHERFILGRVKFIEGPNYFIDLEKMKSFVFNIIISSLYLLASKMPKHKYWILKINRKLIKLTLRKPHLKQS